MFRFFAFKISLAAIVLSFLGGIYFGIQIAEHPTYKQAIAFKDSILGNNNWLGGK